MAAISISTHNTKFCRSAALSAFLINRDFAARKTRTPCNKKVQFMAWISHKNLLQTEKKVLDLA
jgi:hypothetical protein